VCDLHAHRHCFIDRYLAGTSKASCISRGNRKKAGLVHPRDMDRLVNADSDRGSQAEHGLCIHVYRYLYTYRRRRNSHLFQPLGLIKMDHHPSPGVRGFGGRQTGACEEQGARTFITSHCIGLLRWSKYKVAGMMYIYLSTICIDKDRELTGRARPLYRSAMRGRRSSPAIRRRGTGPGPAGTTRPLLAGHHKDGLGRPTCGATAVNHSGSPVTRCTLCPLMLRTLRCVMRRALWRFWGVGRLVGGVGGRAGGSGAGGRI
jgi:hypothetical protein